MQSIKNLFKKLKIHRSMMFSWLLLGLVALIASDAFAFTAPAATDFAYEVYDFMVIRVLQGPVGFCLGVGAMAFGCVQAFRNAVMQGLVIAAAGLLIMNAENLVTALGAVV